MATPTTTSKVSDGTPFPWKCMYMRSKQDDLDLYSRRTSSWAGKFREFACEEDSVLFNAISRYCVHLPVNLLGQLPCPDCSTRLKVFPAHPTTRKPRKLGWSNFMAHLKRKHNADRTHFGMVPRGENIWGVPPTPARGATAADQKQLNDEQRVRRSRAFHKVRERQARAWAALKTTQAMSSRDRARALRARDARLEANLGLLPGVFGRYDAVKATVLQLQGKGYHGIRLNYHVLFEKDPSFQQTREGGKAEAKASGVAHRLHVEKKHSEPPAPCHTQATDSNSDSDSLGRKRKRHEVQQEAGLTWPSAASALLSLARFWGGAALPSPTGLSRFWTRGMRSRKKRQRVEEDEVREE